MITKKLGIQLNNIVNKGIILVLSIYANLNADMVELQTTPINYQPIEINLGSSSYKTWTKALNNKMPNKIE